MALLSRQQPFLEMLDEATTKKECGLYLFEEFLSAQEARDAFDILVDDAKFPWDTQAEEPQGENDLLESAIANKERNGAIRYNRDLKGLLKLGELCAQIELTFDVRVSSVFCNRLPNPRDNNNCWSNENYGEHFCVLTLGSSRRIEFRNNRTQEIDSITPFAGDLYMMPRNLDETHTVSVCPVDDNHPVEENNDALLSFVFFFEAPTYAHHEFEMSPQGQKFGFVDDDIVSAVNRRISV